MKRTGRPYRKAMLWSFVSALILVAALFPVLVMHKFSWLNQPLELFSVALLIAVASAVILIERPSALQRLVLPLTCYAIYWGVVTLFLVAVEGISRSELNWLFFIKELLGILPAHLSSIRAQLCFPALMLGPIWLIAAGDYLVRRPRPGVQHLGCGKHHLADQQLEVQADDDTHGQGTTGGVTLQILQNHPVSPQTDRACKVSIPADKAHFRKP